MLASARPSRRHGGSVRARECPSRRGDGSVRARECPSRRGDGSVRARVCPSRRGDGSARARVCPSRRGDGTMRANARRIAALAERCGQILVPVAMLAERCGRSLGRMAGFAERCGRLLNRIKSCPAQWAWISACSNIHPAKGVQTRARIHVGSRKCAGALGRIEIHQANCARAGTPMNVDADGWAPRRYRATLTQPIPPWAWLTEVSAMTPRLQCGSRILR